MADQEVVGGGAEQFVLPTEAAYAELLPEISALPDGDEIKLNADVMASVTLVLGVLPRLRALRADVAELPRFNLARFDKLEKYTLALSHAHTLQRSAMPDRGNVTDLGGEVTDVRDRLYADAMSLAGYQLVDEARLKECKKANGYRAAATDVFTLIAVLKERWPNVEGKTPMTLDSLNHAGNRAVELLAAIGERDQAPVDVTAAARLKQKAFSLFVAAYEDARRAMEYLRAEHGDADDIAPSIWSNNTPHRRAEPAHPPAPTEAAKASNAASPAAGEKPVVMDNSASLPVTSPFTN